LKDAGNIPVDRKNKDNQKLFSGTFEALKAGEAVAIFPEGTSYTEPRLQEIKDGASWVGPYLGLRHLYIISQADIYNVVFC
jgi:glycerol-3-phosphate O-acyltransferase/dihydroxyacetone phosphate acyltransferase